MASFRQHPITGSEAGLALGWAYDVMKSDASGTAAVEVPQDMLEELRGGGPVVEAPEERLPEMEETSSVQIHSSDFGFAEMVDLPSAFASWIRDPNYRNPAIATSDDGLAHVKVIDEVERSRKEGRWIDLD